MNSNLQAPCEEIRLIDGKPVRVIVCSIESLPYISSEDHVLEIIKSGRVSDYYLDRFFTGAIARAIKRVGRCGYEWDKWAKEWLSGEDLTKAGAGKAADIATDYCRKQPNARFISARWTAKAASYHIGHEYAKAQYALMQAAGFGEWSNKKAMAEENYRQYKSISVFIDKAKS